MREMKDQRRDAPTTTAGQDKRANIEDVAAAAGVSVATVSRALRDLPNVAPSTRDRVLAVASELAYVANPTASRLAGGRTGTVAVVVPVFDSWYFAKVVAGIEAVLKDADIDLLLYAVDSEDARKKFLAGRGAWWQRGDALIMVDVRLTEAEANRFDQLGARIVTVGCETPNFSSITLDEKGAAAAAARHLIDTGHTRIGVLTGHSKAHEFRVPVMRLEGFQAELEALGHPLDSSLVRSGGFSLDGGRDGMVELLELENPPTAVFSMSDEMAFGALDAIKSHNLRSPEDVAIVGFDDNDLATLFGLTTVRQKVETIGAIAGRLVLRAMQESDRMTEHVVTPTELIVRATA